MDAMNNSADELPKSRNHVVAFVCAILCICVGLYVVDVHVAESAGASDASDDWKQHAGIIRSVIENLIAGAIAAMLLAMTYRWVLALIDPSDRVIELPPGSITERLKKNARKTRSYLFIGNTASFVSTTVLPILVESSRSSGHPKSLSLFLIDPTDAVAIASYVAYRDRVGRSASKAADETLAIWIPPQARKVESCEEVIAKVLSAIYLAAFAAVFPGMSVSVFVRRSFTPFRADISDSEVVLTQESASESAVAFSARGHFYGWYQKEADAQKGQVQAIDLSAMREELRALDLAYPTAPRQEIAASLTALIGLVPYLAPLLATPGVVDLAAKKICSPNRQYQ